MSESARDDFELLDQEFDEMILASYPNTMLADPQYSDLRCAFFGGIRIALNFLYGDLMTFEQMEIALGEFVTDLKEKHGIDSKAEPTKRPDM